MDIQDEPFWRTRPDALRHGEQRTHDGRPVHWEALVRRAWGWPSSAGNMAAAELKRASAGSPLVVFVGDEMRRAQQDQLFGALPDLREILCRGLCHGATKEARDAGRELSSVTLAFTRPITDDGLVSGIMRALAIRLACTVEDIRQAATFDPTYNGARHITVRTSDFEAK